MEFKIVVQKRNADVWFSSNSTHKIVKYGPMTDRKGGVSIERKNMSTDEIIAHATDNGSFIYMNDVSGFIINSAKPQPDLLKKAIEIMRYNDKKFRIAEKLFAQEEYIFTNCDDRYVIKSRTRWTIM